MKSLKPLHRIQGNFGLKIFLSLICAMVILASIFNYIYNRTQTRNYEQQIRDNGIILSQFTANAVKLGIFAADLKLIGEVFNPVLTTKGIVKVCALDSQQRLLLSRNASPDISPITCLATADTVTREAFMNRMLNASEPVYIENDKLLEFWAPVLSKGPAFDNDTLFFDKPELEKTADRGEVIGYVGVTMDKTLLKKGLQAIIRTNIFMLIIALLIGSIITFFIVRTATKPLQQLTDRVKKQNMPAAATDELDFLSGTFDNMLEQLGKSFTTIQGLQKGLENKVKELQQEIEDHARTEKARKRSERQYQTLIETIKDIVYTLDTEATITYVSPIVERLTGYAPGELMGRKFLDFLNPLFMESAAEQFSRGKEPGVNISYEAEFIKKDGTTLFLEANDTTLLDADGKVIGRLGSARDVTKRKQMEKYRQELEVKAFHQSKLAALGEIAAGVAHEINQPLSYIKVVYESTLNDMELNQLDNAELQTDCREALRQVARITKIVNHLRTFGRNDHEFFQHIDLRNSLDNIMILMEKKLEQNTISLTRDIAENLAKIYGSSTNMEQVLINLMQNSVNTLEGRKDGKITISMHPEADMMVIRFIDNGPGIPPEIQARIFEPFFTTREVGKGTGLGLSIIYGIIEEHKGTIAFESIPGQGCLFSISLPLAIPPPAVEEE